MSVNPEALRENLLQAQILDSPGRHHEFASGKHGVKADFDKLNGDFGYGMWTNTVYAFLLEQQVNPEVLIGVGGANRLALDVARKYDGRVIGLTSQKDPNNKHDFVLPDVTRRVLSSGQFEKAVILDEVGETGRQAAEVGKLALAAGIPAVEVVYTWQRQSVMPALDEAGIAYRSIITGHNLTSYPADDCPSCDRGDKLIPYVPSD